MNQIHHTHVLLSVTLRRLPGSIIMTNSNIDRANELAKKSGKPCAITEDGNKFYTFTVVSKGEKQSFVELTEVDK